MVCMGAFLYDMNILEGEIILLSNKWSKITWTGPSNPPLPPLARASKAHRTPRFWNYSLLYLNLSSRQPNVDPAADAIVSSPKYTDGWKTITRVQTWKKKEKQKKICC